MWPCIRGVCNRRCKEQEKETTGRRNRCFLLDRRLVCQGGMQTSTFLDFSSELGKRGLEGSRVEVLLSLDRARFNREGEDKK